LAFANLRKFDMRELSNRWLGWLGEQSGGG
jgi:hypothetical protein